LVFHNFVVTKDFFARDPSGGETCLQRLAYLALVPVSFRAIEVPKSGFQGTPGRSYRHGGVGNQGAKAECGHLGRLRDSAAFSTFEDQKTQSRFQLRATLRPASPPEVKKLDARPQRKTWGLPETAHGICNGWDIIITIRVFERLRLHLDGFQAGKRCSV
jgi:hypothetical protein